ncbi:MAG: hypothetical protein ACK4WH_09420 [Phycisphaerales bacterium]
MFRRLGSFYARRIVNVNVNIVLAGLLALIPTLGVVHLVERMLASGFHPNDALRISDQAMITGVTFFADVFFDVTIYYALHWLANHSRKRQRAERLGTIADAAAENVPFFRDATKIQIQRIVLSPILYIIFLGGQFTLMTVLKVRPVYATVIGFCGAVLVVRTLHTFWMLGEARGRAAALAGRVCAACGHDLKSTPATSPCPECGSMQSKTGVASTPPLHPQAPVAHPPRAAGTVHPIDAAVPTTATTPGADERKREAVSAKPVVKAGGR